MKLLIFIISFLLIFLLGIVLGETFYNVSVIKDLVRLTSCNTSLYNEAILEEQSNVKIENENIVTIPKHLLTKPYSNYSHDLLFRVKKSRVSPQCSNGSFSIEIPLSPDEINLDIEARFTPNGYLKHLFDYYSPDEFCVERMNKSSLKIRICNPDCEFLTCITRCCEMGEVWDLTDFIEKDGLMKCRLSGQNLWHPTVYNAHGEQVDRKYHVYSSHPREWCKEEDEPIINFLKSFSGNQKKIIRLLENGDIEQKIDRRKWERLSKDKYCMDGAMNFPGENSQSFTGLSEDTLFIDCNPFKIIIPEERPVSTLFGIAMIIASLLLFFTVLVTFATKENVRGWTLLAYFTSLLIMYILFAILHLTSLKLDGRVGTEKTTQNIFCEIIGVCAHFFYISTFSWLTVVNFDVWWTFRALKPTSKSKGRKRFCLYSIFSFGIPAVIIVVGLTMDSLYGDEEYSYIVPDYGKARCFFEPVYAPLPYAYGLIATLLIVNFGFFLFTVHSMIKIRESTKFATSSSSKTSQQKETLQLFAKLFLIMGIPWIFEVISWAVLGSDISNSEWYWVVLDLINICQAVAIFIMFVCKKETVTLLEQKFPSFKRDDFLNNVIGLLNCTSLATHSANYTLASQFDQQMILQDFNIIINTYNK